MDRNSSIARSSYTSNTLPSIKSMTNEEDITSSDLNFQNERNTSEKCLSKNGDFSTTDKRAQKVQNMEESLNNLETAKEIFQNCDIKNQLENRFGKSSNSVDEDTSEFVDALRREYKSIVGFGYL